MLFNQRSLLFYWRKEGVLSTLRDRSMNYSGRLVDKEGNNFYPELYDSGWQTAELSSGFKPYNNEEKYTPKYRKIGKIVEIFGIISPKATIEGSSAWHTIFTLPESFRPVDSVYTICQGSSMNRWVLTVDNSGRVRFGRYGTNNYANATSTVWLPFTITFFIE